MFRTFFFLVLSGLPLAAALPSAAADLKSKRDAKVAEIDRVYAAELDKLQRKAMTEGNLQAANEIQKEIAEVTKDPFSDDEPLGMLKVTADQLVAGEWRFDVKSPAFTTHLRFASSKEVFERGKAAAIGKWEIRNGKLRAEFKSSWNEFDLSYRGSGVVLEEFRHNGGKREGVTLTQIKP